MAKKNSGIVVRYSPSRDQYHTATEREVAAADIRHEGEAQYDWENIDYAEDQSAADEVIDNHKAEQEKIRKKAEEKKRAAEEAKK